VKAANLSLRFACEVAALVAVGWWGWTVSPVLGIVFPLVVAAVWGAFIAPKARRRLPDPGRLGIEFVIFAAATACLVAVGQPIPAAIFAAGATVTALLVRKWPEPIAR
jgi:hypothetical protein